MMDIVDRLNQLAVDYLARLATYDNHTDRTSGKYDLMRGKIDQDCRREAYALLTKDNPDVPTFEAFMEATAYVEQIKKSYTVDDEQPT